MSSAAGTLETISLELSKVFSPLKDELKAGSASAFLRELGLNITAAQETAILRQCRLRRIR